MRQGGGGEAAEQIARNFDALILIGLGDAVGAARLCGSQCGIFRSRAEVSRSRHLHVADSLKNARRTKSLRLKISQITHTEGMGGAPNLRVGPRQGAEARLRLWEQIVERMQMT